MTDIGNIIQLSNTQAKRSEDCVDLDSCQNKEDDKQNQNPTNGVKISQNEKTNPSLKPEKDPFWSPYLDLHLVWARQTFRSISWKDLCLTIHKKCGILIDPNDASKRYELLNPEQRKVYVAEFSCPQPEAFLNVVKEARQMLKHNLYDDSLMDRYVAAYYFYREQMGRTAKQRRLRWTKIIICHKMPSVASTPHLDQLCRILRNRIQGPLTIDSVNTVVCELTKEIINRMNTAILLEYYEITDKFIVPHIDTLIDFLADSGQTAILRKIMELYFIDYGPQNEGKMFSEIGSLLRKLRETQTSSIVVDNIKSHPLNLQPVKLEQQLNYYPENTKNE